MGELYEAFVDTTYRYLLRQTNGNTHDAEDLNSQTWMKVVDGIGGFPRADRRFVAWLLTIARNAFFDQGRSRARRPEKITDDPRTLDSAHDLTSPEDSVIQRETTATILAAINELPRKQRDTIILRFFVGLSVAETAEQLSITPGNVKVRQHRGINALRCGEVWPRNPGATMMSLPKPPKGVNLDVPPETYDVRSRHAG